MATNQFSNKRAAQHRGSIILLISSGAAKITAARLAHHAGRHDRGRTSFRPILAGIGHEAQVTFPKGACLAIDVGHAIIVAVGDCLDPLAGSTDLQLGVRVRRRRADVRGYSLCGLTGCGDTQNPMLAIGRTGDSPARRIARLTMAIDAGSKTLHVLRLLARYSATQPPMGSELRHVGYRRYCGIQLGRHESGCDERPMIADATEALMSRLPTAKG